MALRTEEAQTGGRHCERFHFSVKVLVCDHEDDSGDKCRTGYLFGEGFVRLTVKKGEANSHANIGWEELVGALLRAVAAQPRPVGFLGFGGDAKRMIHGAGPFVATHPCVCVPHPAARPPVTLRSSRPFSRLRDALREVGGELPDLRLP